MVLNTATEYQKMTFSPSDIGIPSVRTRQYMSFYLQPFMRKIKGMDSESFKKIFFRTLAADPTIYSINLPDEIIYRCFETFAKDIDNLSPEVKDALERLQRDESIPPDMRSSMEV